MITEGDVAWGSYRDYEGPFYPGSAPFRLPAQPSEADRILAVITATEGGRWDAYNGYDRCICSSGLIQWCEAGQYSVSDMLGQAAAQDRGLIAGVDELAAESGIEFKPNHRGRWRFFFLDDRGEVDRREEQQALFLGTSTGRKGSWDAASRRYAKRWAAAISSVWQSPRAQALQGAYTAARLPSFALPFARRVLDSAPQTDVGRAFRAAYLSFAANNPSWANRHLERALSQLTQPAWSRDWLIGVLRELTFGPKVAIYPARYDAIRPVLERIYSVDLPDLAADLQGFHQAAGGAPLSVAEVQQVLIDLGFDLGPWGADGRYGAKTTDAVVSFQQLHGLPATGQVDLATQRALLDQRAAAGTVSAELKRRVEALVTLSVARAVREASSASGGSDRDAAVPEV